MWVIGFNALFGNLFVLNWRRHGTRASKVNRFLLSNLATSDLLMGIYMIIIGSADIYFEEYFPMNAEKWKYSIVCKTAGSLSIISSEASVLFITLISIDRFICIRFPYSSKKLGQKSAKILVATTWITSVLLGIVPSFLTGSAEIDFTVYDNSYVCIGLPLAVTSTYVIQEQREEIRYDMWYTLQTITYNHQFNGYSTGLYFSTAVFLGLNSLCYLLIVGCYVEILRAVRNSSKQSGRARDMTEQIRLTTKVSAIVVTDFCCWFPVIILGILVQTRAITLHPSVFAWCVTFVLPINSAINPYLYTISEVISNYRRKRAENKQLQDIFCK